MSMQEQDGASGATPPRSGGLINPLKSKNPTCPKCERRMTVKQVTPVLFASGVDDVLYGCGACGTEIKRSVKHA